MHCFKRGVSMAVSGVSAGVNPYASLQASKQTPVSQPSAQELAQSAQKVNDAFGQPPKAQEPGKGTVIDTTV